MPFSGAWRYSAAICISLALLVAAAFPADSVLDGFSSASSHSERDWEAKFIAIPSPTNQREYMQRLSARPHNVGSPYDKDNAEWLLKKFQDWGYDAHIETFSVLFPTPKERLLELIAPQHFKAALAEPPIAIDPTSAQTSEQLPTYNAYSGDGDVTGPLVYVNYGMPADYEELDRLGVSVKGAIAVARYGKGWRGVKVKVAAEHGALACILYSDPFDDGYAQGETYPTGAFRPTLGVQRGSVMDTQYPGDPLTPGKPSVPGTPRLPLSEAQTIEKIPVLPISYRDAQPLLSAIGGRTVPSAWRGSLPITYRVGPGPARVHLRMFSNWDQKTIYDVIARMPGSTDPGQWVIRGNHHDAWVNGAEDPISGLVALLEEARAFSELKKQGWSPQRTLIFCAWDGEEPGLLGSTEWVEAHEDELRAHAVAYLNSDTNERGFFSADGSHILEKLLNSVAQDVVDPEKNISIWKRAQDDALATAPNLDARNQIHARADIRIGALGDGSDYTAFIDHAGVPAADIGFSGEGNGGVYHSIYDDFYWYTHFGDPDFLYERALSQTMGLAIMRLADAELIPFDFNGFADNMHKYLDDLEKKLKAEQDDTREQNREIDDGVFQAVSDPTKPTQPPPARINPPYLDFAPLQNAIEGLTKSAQIWSDKLAAIRSSDKMPEPATIQRINQLLLKAGPCLTDPDGLPGRPWFKNQIYAPGAYTGYEAKPIPGVLEAMDRRDWKTANSQIPRAAAALDRETKLLNELAAALPAPQTDHPK